MRPDQRSAKFGRDYYRGRPGLANRMAEVRFAFRAFAVVANRAMRAFDRLSPELQEIAKQAAEQEHR